VVSTPTQTVTTRPMSLILATSIIGTAIEWYDYFLYGNVATLVFPHLFFPKASVFVGTLLSLTTFLVGFIARPIGAALFGHFGDRVGRKSTLIITLLCTGIGTFLIGLMPGYNSIGIAAPILISVMRFLQGLSIGGEWGGSVLLTVENTNDQKRGFWASWPHVGLPLGLVLSSVAIAVFQSTTKAQFDVWGWRIPFLLSIVLVVIGLIIRIRLLETPMFAKLKQTQNIAQAPLVEAFKANWVQIFCSMGAKFVEQAPLYIFQSLLLVYGATYLHLNKEMLIIGIAIGAFFEMFTLPMFSRLSDIIGRRRFYMIGSAVVFLYIIPYFLLLDTRNTALVILAIILSFALSHGVVYGPEAALIVEQFPTRYRYSGAGIAYQLSAPLSGGLAPIIAVYLLGAYHGAYAPVALFVMAIAIISFFAVLGLKERSRLKLAE